MLNFSNALLSKILLSILLFGVAEHATAHTYFFGVTELNINEKNKHIEVVHQLTTHDIENAIAEKKQVNFSPEHPQYDKFIQDYIEGNFILERNNQVIEMNWVGFEIKRGFVFAYQESFSKNHLNNLVVKNTILVDTYAEQTNIVNYQSSGTTELIEGSLTFNQSLKVAKITVPNKN